MMITDAGTLVRTRVSEVSVVGRNTQGVTLIRTTEDEHVVGLQRVAEPEEDDNILEGESLEGEEGSEEDTALNAPEDEDAADEAEDDDNNV
ncbi:DNA gyrase subunit A [Yersinia enterocolitica]|nr:DNA gyrase subunit A [Yersinia enterocolitica]